jgi:hypothetical protein
MGKNKGSSRLNGDDGLAFAFHQLDQKSIQKLDLRIRTVSNIVT